MSGSRTATDAKAPAKPERILRWDGCVNVRDLGGLPLAGGGETAYRVVVRADWLPGLSEAGRQALVEYGVSLVVDLRSEREHGGPERLAGLVVVAEVADVGPTRGVDDHVVAVEGGEAGEIGVHDETAALESEEPAVRHRDDQQAAVREPAETRGLRRHLDDRLDDTVGRHGDDALAVHVGDPEAAVAPARPLEEVEAVGHHAKVGGHAAVNKHLAHILRKPGWGAPTALTAVARAAATGAGG